MHILYLGDNAGTSAEYLKDCLSELEHSFDHFDSQTDMSQIKEDYDCIILSDYPAHRLDRERSEAIKRQVEQGSRFIMLGGWDSFNGRGTNYFNHPMSGILPVTLQRGDDRVNASQGLILKADDALQTDLLIDWQNPPVICGYNAFEAKANATVLVWASPIQSNGFTISLLQPLPLVVKGEFGQGNVIACATDLAPHWSGGLVDWGSERRELPHVEVGDMYILFTKFLLEI